MVFIGTVLELNCDRPVRGARTCVDRAFKGKLESEIKLFYDGMCDGPREEPDGSTPLPVHRATDASGKYAISGLPPVCTN